jgi:hypothetical protein
VAKHGSLAAVAEEKQRRVKDKIEGRARRRAAEQQAEQVAAEVATRVQAAVGRRSTQSAGKQALEEGARAQPLAACLLFQGRWSGVGLFFCWCAHHQAHRPLAMLQQWGIQKSD